MVTPDDLAEHDLRELVKFIQKEEPKLVGEYLRSTPPVKVRLAIEWLHSLCCSDSHPPCSFYDEDEVDCTWDQLAHTRWWGEYYAIAKKLDLAVQDFSDYIYQFKLLQEEITRIQDNWAPKFGRFVSEILSINPTVFSPSYRTASDPALSSGSTDLPIEIASGSAQLFETDQ